MPAIIQLTATRINRFFSNIVKARTGVADVMHIEDGNKLIDIVNVLAKNASLSVTNQYGVNDPGGVVPTLSSVNGGVYVCQGTCPCSQPASELCKELYCCGASGYYGLTFVRIGSVTNPSPGVYGLTILPFFSDGGTITNWNNVVLSVGNPKVPGIITVEKVTPTEFTITTYNLAGVASAGILDTAIITLTGYIPFIAGGWQDIPDYPKN